MITIIRSDDHEIASWIAITMPNLLKFNKYTAKLRSFYDLVGPYSLNLKNGSSMLKVDFICFALQYLQWDCGYIR